MAGCPSTRIDRCRCACQPAARAADAGAAAALTSSTANPPGRRTRSYSRSMALIQRADRLGAAQLLAEGRIGHQAIHRGVRQRQARGVPARSSAGPSAAQIDGGGADGAEIEVAAPHRRATAADVLARQPSARPGWCRRRTSDRGRRGAAGSRPGGPSPRRWSAAATPADVPACKCDAAWSRSDRRRPHTAVGSVDGQPDLDGGVLLDLPPACRQLARQALRQRLAGIAAADSRAGPPSASPGDRSACPSAWAGCA